MSPRQERVGLLCAGLCALNGAFVPAVAKLTTNAGDPMFVALVSTVFGGVTAAGLLTVRGRLGALFAARNVAGLLAVATLGTGFAFVLFFQGARRATAIETVLCLQIEPAYSLLLAWLALGHRPSLRRVFATLLLLLGIAFAVGARGVQASLGISLLLATPLCWQLSHLVVLRRLVGVEPEVLTGARYIFGSAVLAVFWLLGGGLETLPTAEAVSRQLPLLATQGIVFGYVATLLWYGAVTRLDLARATAIVVPSIPLLSLGASFLILGESPAPAQWVGLALVGLGVLGFVTAPHVAGRTNADGGPGSPQGAAGTPPAA